MTNTSVTLAETEIADAINDGGGVAKILEIHQELPGRTLADDDRGDPAGGDRAGAPPLTSG